MPAPLRPDGPDRVVVHTSVRGLLAGAISPAALLLLGGVATLDGGPRPLPLLFLVGGLALGVVVAFDLPTRVEFDREGLTRVCPLRRQRVPWSRVVAIERTRPGSATVARNLVDRRSARAGPTVSGGLVARGSGRRRWLLTDRVESRDEHATLGALLERVPEPVALRAPAPHEGAPPSDLYRRRRERG
jgi:hypothetical protein